MPLVATEYKELQEHDFHSLVTENMLCIQQVPCFIYSLSPLRPQDTKLPPSKLDTTRLQACTGKMPWMAASTVPPNFFSLH